MRLGRVNSDKQAFRQVLQRLEGDVGTILELIEEGKEKGHFKDKAPFSKKPVWRPGQMRVWFPDKSRHLGIMLDDDHILLAVDRNHAGARCCCLASLLGSLLLFIGT